MRTDLPSAVQDRFFDFYWDRESLWATPGIECPIPVAELAHCLELPIWRRETTQAVFDLAPAEALLDLETFPMHRERIENADFLHPIIVMPNRRGEVVIMDGYHRYARAWRDGAREIAARVLSRDVIPSIRREEPPSRPDY